MSRYVWIAETWNYEGPEIVGVYGTPDAALRAAGLDAPGEAQLLKEFHRCARTIDRYHGTGIARHRIRGKKIKHARPATGQ